MFNPSDLPISIGSKGQGEGSFVGVRSNVNGQTEFCIPLGFDNFPSNDTQKVNRLFFDLYKVFRTFARGKEADLRNNTKPYRDGSISSSKGFSFTDKDEENVTLYSKIPMIESVLEKYDELRIFVLTDQDRRTQDVNYTRIDRYLSKAVYLDHDIAFIDGMVLPSPVISYSVSDLVRMYCFIYVELKRALNEEESVNVEVRAQAGIFKIQHLKTDSALFLNANHSDTISLLKETLNEIDRQVSWKDVDFWYFFETIEVFLYGDLTQDGAGPHWGISRFSSIWEDMCLCWAFSRDPKHIVYADTWRFANTNLAGFRVFIAPGFKSPFYITQSGSKRFMRPDLVRQQTPRSPDDVFEDWFDIKPLPIRGYRVKVKRKDKSAKNCFTDFSKLLFVKGARKPAANADSHDFRLVSQAQLTGAVIKIKEILSKIPFTSRTMLLDFKYVSGSVYTTSTLGRKATSDFTKQVVYESCVILNNGHEEVTSEFCIPKYYPNSEVGIGNKISDSLLNTKLVGNKLEVLEANFELLADFYTTNVE